MCVWSRIGSVDLESVQRRFKTSVGAIQVGLDEETGLVSAYRLDRDGRPVAAALDEWGNTDLAELLSYEAGVPPGEAEEIASTVNEEWLAPGASSTPRASHVPAWALWILLVTLLAVCIWAAFRAFL
jgi:hypothetical protein